MKKRLILSLFGFCLFTTGSFAAELSVPENLAIYYYAKLRAGDFESVTKCIDTEELARFKQKLVSVIDAGFFASLPPQALNVLTQGERLVDAKAAPPEKLFERFMEMMVLLDPSFKDVLVQSSTAIIGSVPENRAGESIAHVLVRVVSNRKHDSRIPVVVLTARQHDRKWRLLMPPDINQVLEMLYAQAGPQVEGNTTVQELIDAGPAKAYTEVMNVLSAGKQKDAEGMLDVLVGKFPEDQPLVFLQAVCSRSRWAKSRAAWQFQRTMELNPSSLEGKCARYMLNLDARKMTSENMNGLRVLLNQNPDNPLLLWLMGIACQDNYKHTGGKGDAQRGKRSYEALLKIWDVGPVLLHQTYANILSDQLGLHEEALKHRQLAVQLEPAGWTYEGLANTLTGLKRFDEANDAFKKLMEIESDNARYWHDWGKSRRAAKDYKDCIEKFRQSIALDPTRVEAYRSWAWALVEQDKSEEALAIYLKVIAMTPNDASSYKNAAAMLTRLGRADEAEKMMDARKKLPDW